jgi:ABC-2 type transport system ATP-binding protein
VTRAVLTDQREDLAGYEVESERGRDVRRELARTIVTKGWGLLELRPMRMSLEEIFLHLTTEEVPEESPAAQPGTRTHAETEEEVARG